MPGRSRTEPVAGATAPQKRRGWSIPDWAGLIGCAIALLGFFGYGTYQAFLSPQAPAPQPPVLQQPVARPAAGAPYRQASEVGGTRWATTYKGVAVVIDFSNDGHVSLSNSELGVYGRWQARDRNAIQIDTPNVTIAATLTTDRSGMSAAIYQPGSSLQLGAATLRRVQ